MCFNVGQPNIVMNKEYWGKHQPVCELAAQGSVLSVALCWVEFHGMMEPLFQKSPHRLIVTEEYR